MQNEPPKKPTQTTFLCISLSVDGQLVELTYKPFITNWGSFVLLQIGANVITNWGSYYNLGQPLFQIGASVTNWRKLYYKLGQLLKIEA